MASSVPLQSRASSKAHPISPRVTDRLPPAAAAAAAAAAEDEVVDEEDDADGRLAKALPELLPL